MLELVEGPTLADRIAHGAMPIEDALPIARQIAEALEAAHEAGVIHRDLKPANIKVRDDGTVKVLDFGLAKALAPLSPWGEGRGEGDDLSQSPTVTAVGTQHGVILGTAAYMSPEQARGKTLDKRTDIWSFGCVLFEMLTGHPVFAGDTLSDTIANVLDREPDWSRLPGRLSPGLRPLLDRCLRRPLRERFRDVADVRLAVEDAIEAAGTLPAKLTVAARTRFWQQPTAVVCIALGATVLAGLGVWSVLGRVDRPVSSPKRLTVTLPGDEQLPSGSGEMLALSPDGQTLLYRVLDDDGAEWLVRRPMDQFDATSLPTESGAGSHRAFFSPDGQSVGYYANGVLNRIAVGGGPPLALTPRLPSYMRGADWGPDDTIVFALAERPGLLRVPADGGEPQTLFTSDDGRLSWYPEILADGDAILFTLTTWQRFPTTVELHLLFPETGEHRTVVPNASAGRVLATGHLVFVRNGDLWAVRFDPEQLAVVGTPVPILEGVLVNGGAGAVQYAVSDDGSTLVYVPSDDGEVRDQTLVLVDREGARERLTLPPGEYERPRFSPDGSRIAVYSSIAGSILLYERSRGRATPLTEATWGPVWTPDGSAITFMDGGAIWNIASDFSGEPQVLSPVTAGSPLRGPDSWNPDGNALLWPGRRGDVHLLTLLDGAEVSDQPLLAGPHREVSPTFSPDGRWLSYASDETESQNYGSPDIKVGRSPGRSDQELCDLGRNRLIHGFFWDLQEQYFLASVDGRLRRPRSGWGACSAAAKSRRKVFNLWLLLDDRWAGDTAQVEPVR